MEPPKEALGSLYQNHRTHPEKQQVTGAQEDQLGEGGSAALRKGTSSPTDRALAHDARFTPRQQRSAGEAQRGEMMTLQLKPPHGAKRLKCVNKRKALDKALRLSSKLHCIMWE